MTVTPTLAPPEAQPDASVFNEPLDNESEALAKPFRLGVIGVGIALGLFARMASANDILGDLGDRSLLLISAATSLIVGIGLALTAAERDRFGAPLVWLTAITGLSWGALNWLSPPFDDTVTVWSNPDQAVLAAVGVGNGVLLAGLVALAFVRRGPTLTVAATLFAALATLVGNTLLLREQWPGILAIAIAFALFLLAWDRSPRREKRFVPPEQPPRVSRAALSFISVALCGTALQLWISRTDIPRSLPAIALSVVLICGAFASMVRVRREIEQRETTLSEWTSWMREIRTNDFRSEIETFDSSTDAATFDPRPPIGYDGEAPRKLSFPNLVVTDPKPTFVPAVADEPVPADDELAAGSIELPVVDEPSLEITLPWADTATGVLPQADTTPATTSALGLPQADRPNVDVTAEPATTLPRVGLTADQPDVAIDQPMPTDAPAATEAASGAFSAMLGAVDQPAAPTIAGLAALEAWLNSPTAPTRAHPLLVAIEAMSLDEFESLPPEDAAMARDEIGRYLADTLPDAELVAYIDGPYFITAYSSKPMSEVTALNKTVQAAVKGTDGVHAFVRPGADASIDLIVDEAVIGILQARQNQPGR